MIIEKRCSCCKQIKNVTEFSKSDKFKSGYVCVCRECVSKKNKEYSDKHKKQKIITNKKYYSNNIETIKDNNRRNHLRRTFQLLPEDYDKLLEEQGGVCAICGGKSGPYSNLEHRLPSLCVDHNHKTGKIRGLLCHRCNIWISGVEYNKQLVQAAYNYLDMYE